MALRAKDLKKARHADLHPNTLWFRLLLGRVNRLRLGLKRGFRKSNAGRVAAMLKAPVRRSDWQAAHAIVSDWARTARANRDLDLLERLSNDMRRLGDLRGSFELAARCKEASGSKELHGDPLDGKTLLIERRGGDFATFFLFASPVAMALQRCRKCIVLVEERLMPLFIRTFPDADVRPESGRERALEEADCVTSFEGLAFHLGWDGRQSVALKADPGLARSFREKYLAEGHAPLVGISWGSVNKYKESPAVRDWVELMKRSKSTFVSLQYGDTRSAVESFHRAAPDRLICDESVDQLVDMDRFAAQVASLDAVVTISNTVAHAGGALGTRTYVLLDGQFKRSWPAFGREVPWYQSCICLRKSSGGWRSLMQEVQCDI